MNGSQNTLFTSNGTKAELGSTTQFSRDTSSQIFINLLKIAFCLMRILKGKALYRFITPTCRTQSLILLMHRLMKDQAWQSNKQRHSKGKAFC